MLNSVGFEVKEGKTVDCREILLELYKEQDKSQLISRRIDIYNSIYSNDDFRLNQILNKENIYKLREKSRGVKIFDPARVFRRMGSQRSFNGEQTNWTRRKSKTLDPETLHFLVNNLRGRNRRMMNVVPQEKGFEFGVFRRVFFLINYLNGNENIQDENDFMKIFMDFYFQLIGSFKKFRVKFKRRGVICRSCARKSKRRIRICRKLKTKWTSEVRFCVFMGKPCPRKKR